MFSRIRWWMVLAMMAPVLALAAAPDLRLRDLEGRERHVNEFIGRGQWTVVAVWSADCSICRRDIFHMAFFYDEHRKKDAAVLGLSVDGFGQRDKARKFIEDQSLDFPNLIGGPADARRLSGAEFIGTPTYYFFSPDGKFMTQRVGSVTQRQAEQVIRDLKKSIASK